MNQTQILVTGCSGCLGAFLCDAYLSKGHRVTGIDLAEPAEALKLRASTGTGGFHFVRCDLSDANAIQSALLELHAKGGPFDVVINNVGLIYSAPLLIMREGQLVAHGFEAWRKVVDVTLSAGFYVTALCAREMAAKMRKGVIVNISSICASGNAGQASYSAAKAGVNALTVSLAKELGPLGIRVAAVAPGFLDTESTRQALPQDRLEQIRKAIPLKRLGTLEELAAAVDFVIRNPYFHGKVLELDGGLTL